MKNNIKIAEYMGYETYGRNGHIIVKYSDNNERTLQDTHYHNDWSWLIPVIKKIDSYANEEMYISDYMDYKENYPFISNISIHNDITDIYNQVVKFIDNIPFESHIKDFK